MTLLIVIIIWIVGGCLLYLGNCYYRCLRGGDDMFLMVWPIAIPIICILYFLNKWGNKLSALRDAREEKLRNKNESKSRFENIEEINYKEIEEEIEEELKRDKYATHG